MESEKIEKLIQPFKIGSTEIKNRMIMSPMITNYANRDGSVTDRLIAYYKARANGGVGLIVVESAYIHPSGKGFENQLGIYDDKLIPGLKKLVEEVHKAGSKIFLQLYHAGRQTDSTLTRTTILAPSAIPCPTKKEVPIELSTEAMAGLIESYAQAAERAKKAGFDGVEIQGANGCLLNQFLSPYSNKRTDQYGGSLENRMRFPLQVVAAIRNRVGKDYTLTYRFSVYEYVEGGLILADTKPFAKRLEESGVDTLSVSAGANQFMMMTVPPMGVKQACLAYLSKEIKKEVGIPVIVAGRINEANIAERILQEEKADLIALGRALIADPEFPDKVIRGDVDSIRVCIACNQECIGRLSEGKDILCLINAQTGNEETAILDENVDSKKVLVAGGGVAGLEAARVAAARGHDVYLYEKTGELGGKLRSVAQPPRKDVINKLRDHLIYHMDKSGVKVNMNTEVTENVLDELKPDVVILTTGSNPNMPPIPGINAPNVCSADDILNNRKEAGKKVVILGNGLVGAETADWLSELGKEVTLVGKSPEVAPGAEALNKLLMMEALKKKNVTILNNTGVNGILSDGVVIERDGKVEELKGMDTIVVALGYRPNNQLLEVIQKKGIPVYIAGDCIRPRRIAEAIHEAFQVATTV